jgi:hypothetical protein
MSLRKPVAEATAPETELTELIRWIRDRKVMLDRDLARLYEVEVKVLNQAVKRNSSRFPDDFMFQLTEEEVESLRSQIVTLDAVVAGGPAGAAPVRGRGRHAKYRPYAFTEQGVAMLSSVLHSNRAVMVNIEIMRAFVKLRAMLGSNAELSKKLHSLEAKYDRQFKVVFDAIRQIMSPAPGSKRRIGFAPWEDEA